MNDFIKLIFDFFNEFLMFHRNEMINVFFSINLEKFFECLIFSEFGNTIVSEEELLTKLVNSKNFEFTLLCVPTDTSISPFCLASDSFSRQVSFLFDFAKDKFVMNLFLLNFFLIKIIFFKVNSLTFWILPQIILFFGGLLVFLLIKTNDMNLKIWDLTLKILLIAIFYQFILLYLYLNFFNLGLELKVGLSGTFKVPFNFFLAKLLSFLIILILLFISTYFLKRFYFKTLFLIKPELCSLTLFLGFGSGMVFLQNDLFSIFLYLEIVSFCIYGFLFLQQRSNSQLHGLIRYVLFSLWMASFYILGVALYLSWTNFNTNLSYFFDNGSLFNEVATTRPDYKLSMSHGIINFEITLSILCFLFYFLFKLGAGPFYTWVIEVYNSCSTGVLLIVSVIPKLVYTPILFFLLFFNFINYYAYWSSILFIIGVATTVIGSIGILYTDKLKEIYSWSSVIHTGNVLIILSCVTQATLAFCFFYLVSYVIISVGFVSIIVSLWNKITGRFIKTLSELNSLNYLSSGFLIISMLILSSASGFTPLISFFMKFSLFSMIVTQHGAVFAIIVGLLNIIGSVAYLKMLWSMVGFNINDFFFKKKNKHHAPIIISIDYGFSFFLYILCLFICFGFFFYNEFLNLFDYPTNVFYPDQGEVIVRVLYYGK